jgi:CubicO group peptidase (beta-lactamase class C family)
MAAAALTVTNLSAADPEGAVQPHAFPSGDWETSDPESAGYSQARLEALRAWLEAQPTTAMMVVAGGKVIFSYGDLGLTSKIASVRKSVLAMLYGRYVVDGTINLTRPVKDLGLQEAEPFLPIEEFATLEHLITARSGIYLPSGNADLDLLAPKRGSQFPGTFHDYNNWDFNAAGTAFEKLTGRDIFDALEVDLARPIGMQDYVRADQRKVSSPGSVHPEYAMYLSTRDMARLGLLMLRGGTWTDTVVVPAEWCRHITSLITPWTDVHPAQLRVDGLPDRWGYGVMWW